MEALRKLDQQFGRIERARRYAPRPYEIVVLSDHGQTQGATFKQRNGYGLDELVERSLDARRGRRLSPAATSSTRWSATRSARRPGTQARSQARKNDVSDRDVVVLGSGNLGLVYLMEEPRRLTLEEIDERHPRADPGAARAPAHRLAAGALGRARRRRARRRAAPATSPRAASRARTRSRTSRPRAARHLLRTDGFAHVADIMVGSFYDPELDEGCAFEELISLPRRARRPADARRSSCTRATCRCRTSRSCGAAAVHGVLAGWRRER